MGLGFGLEIRIFVICRGQPICVNLDLWRKTFVFPCIIFYAGIGGEGGWDLEQKGGCGMSCYCYIMAKSNTILYKLQASSLNMKNASNELKINLRHPKK